MAGAARDPARRMTHNCSHSSLENGVRMALLRNIIFDMGNVLMTFDGHEFASAFTEDEEDADLLYAALFGRTEWALLDSGTIDHATMLRVAEAHIPERLLPNLYSCFDHWPELSRPLEAKTTSRVACTPRALASTCSPTPRTGSSSNSTAHPRVPSLTAWSSPRRSAS